MILPDLKSETVARALRDDVLKHGWGRPEQWVCDGASYFKAEVKAGITAWAALQRVSAPHHSESHGIIERHNQTYLDNYTEVLWQYYYLERALCSSI